MNRAAFLVPLALAAGIGCISVKTENEIKPIHITMDVNLKVDRELDKAFADENHAKPKGNYMLIKDMMDRKIAGLTNAALLEARAGASDDDRIAIAEENAKRLKRFSEIAKSSGVELKAVQQRYTKKFCEKIPSGSGVWIQAEDGTWSQK